jgi:hypothetical protein
MSRESKDGLPTDKDPHPARETETDEPSHPGGAHPPKGPDVGSNSYVHDGKAPPRPDNKGAGEN